MDAELIQSDPAVMMGKPVVAGTRVTVESILEKLSAGETIEEVVRAHPRLTREGVLAALGFAAGALRTGESGDTIPSDMGGRKFLLLKADIDRELAQVGGLLEETRSDLKGAGGVPSRLEVRGVASVLQDFYSGVERVFERIAVELDGELPRGGDWHSRGRPPPGPDLRPRGTAAAVPAFPAPVPGHRRRTTALGAQHRAPRRGG